MSINSKIETPERNKIKTIFDYCKYLSSTTTSRTCFLIILNFFESINFDLRKINLILVLAKFFFKNCSKTVLHIQISVIG